MDYCPLSSESCVMDCGQDSSQDGFFCTSSGGAVSCEDIWELLPTPPRSPSRPCSDDEFDSICLLSDPKLDLDCDPLDILEFAVWGDWPRTTVGLKNDLLHDCMWSGLCAGSCKRNHLPSQPPNGQTEETRASTPAPTEPEAAPTSVLVKTEPPPDVVSRVGPSPALPVDPFTMLPYTPLSDHSYHNQNQLASHQHQPRTPPICDTPSDTEDEIDVVTLPESASLTSTKPEISDVHVVVRTCEVPRAKRRPGRPRTVPPLRVVIRTSNVVSEQEKDRRGRHHTRKRFQKRLNKVKSSAAALSTTSSGGWARRHYKRHFTSHKFRGRGTTESCSSDSEDCVEKRSMHNSMERKRRDDLRFAFQTLREHVPELASNPKAPKVLILNRAASYARQLSQTGAALEKALKQENRRKQELQRKLMQLSKMK